MSTEELSKHPMQANIPDLHFESVKNKYQWGSFPEVSKWLHVCVSGHEQISLVSQGLLPVALHPL